MRKLILKEGSDAHEYALLESAIIGRGGASTIKLDFNRIESEHAKITRTGPNTFVEDLDSPQGITVNGKKVSRWALKKGDMIGLGPVVLLYDEDNKPDPPPPAPKKEPSAKPIANGKDHGAPTKPKAAQGSSSVIAPAVARSGVQPAVNKAASRSAIQPAPKVDAPTPAGKSSQLIAAIELPKVSNQTAGAKTAVGMPAISRSNIQPAAKSPNGKSSPALGAISPGARLSVGGSSGVNPAISKSGIVPAAGKSGVNPAIPKSGFNPAVSSQSKIALSGSQSSTRMQAASAEAVDAISKRLASMTAGEIAQVEGQALAQSQANRKLLLAVSVLGVLVLIMGAVLAAIWLRSGEKQSSEERQILERLHGKGPKLSDDLSKVMQRLKGARRVSDVTDILGEPHVKLEKEIPLWSPAKGTEHYPGPAFYVYYMSDRDEGTMLENPVMNVMLFMIDGDRAEFMGPRKYARTEVPPDKAAADAAAKSSDDLSTPPPPPPLPELPAPATQTANATQAQSAPPPSPNGK